jgi:hypothetical protein
MGELYERLSSHGTGRIPVDYAMHTFNAWANGDITGPQAQAIIDRISGTPLGTIGVQEVQDLRNTIPVGTTTTIRLDRLERVGRIARTFQLMEEGAPPYNDLAFVRTLLGVPAR